MRPLRSPLFSDSSTLVVTGGAGDSLLCDHRLPAWKLVSNPEILEEVQINRVVRLWRVTGHRSGLTVSQQVGYINRPQRVKMPMRHQCGHVMMSHGFGDGIWKAPQAQQISPYLRVSDPAKFLLHLV